MPGKCQERIDICMSIRSWPDQWYFGRGLSQLTGRTNDQDASAALFRHETLIALPISTAADFILVNDPTLVANNVDVAVRRLGRS